MKKREKDRDGFTIEKKGVSRDMMEFFMLEIEIKKISTNE